MTQRWRTLLLNLVALTVAAVGVVDAGRSRDGDLVAVFVTIVVLQVLVVVSRRSPDRREVPVRRDLADWLDERARNTGDTVEQVVDRMVTQYRSLWPPLG
jgi:hypothetical protein